MPGFCRCWCQRLVDHDVQARRERCESERYMASVGRGDNDQIELRSAIPELRGIPDDGGIRNRVARSPLSRWVAGHDRRDIESWRRRDQRSMKDRAGKPVANKSDSNRASRN